MLACFLPGASEILRVILFEHLSCSDPSFLFLNAYFQFDDQICHMLVIELLQIVVYRIGIDIIFDSVLINVQLIDCVENYWMRSE